MECHTVLNTTTVTLERFPVPTTFAPGGHCRIYYQLLNTSSEEALVDADQMSFIQMQSSNVQEVIQYIDVYRCPHVIHIYGYSWIVRWPEFGIKLEYELGGILEYVIYDYIFLKYWQFTSCSLPGLPIGHGCSFRSWPLGKGQMANIYRYVKGWKSISTVCIY